MNLKNTLKLVLLGVVLAIFGPGCASATRTTTNNIESTGPAVGQTLSDHSTEVVKKKEAHWPWEKIFNGVTVNIVSGNGGYYREPVRYNNGPQSFGTGYCPPQMVRAVVTDNCGRGHIVMVPAPQVYGSRPRGYGY